MAASRPGLWSLGQAYYDAGDYPRAMESLERNVVTLQGDLRYERSGTNGSVPVTSRAWLSYCHTERGAFPEALAMAEDGLRLAETVQSPFSQIEAWYGVSLVYQRQGDVPRAIPVLERAVGLCQEWHIPLLWPVMAAALGLAYTLEGRDAAGHGRPCLVERDTLPQHTVEHDKGRHAHIDDTVDDRFLACVASIASKKRHKSASVGWAQTTGIWMYSIPESRPPPLHWGDHGASSPWPS
jgi:tetratricopeptide (TPR) repeat protein